MPKVYDFTVGKKDEDGNKVDIGTFTINGPESIEECVEMYGADVALNNCMQSVIISAQALARRVASKESIEKVQETLNAYKPKIGAIRGGTSQSAMVKLFKDLSPEDQAKVLVDAGVTIPGATAPAEATESEAVA